MNILSLNYEYPPLGGGGGHVTKSINERLAQKGYNIDLVTMHFKGLPFEEVINGVRVFRVKSFRRKQTSCQTWEMASFVFSAIPFARRLVKNNKYDLIHCHFAIPTGIVARAINRSEKLDYIITAHGSDIPGHNPDRFTLEHKFTKPLLKKILGNAKTVASPSQYLSKAIRDNISSDIQTTIVPNGIDANTFSPNKPRNNWILMSGRLLSFKGFQYVLNALKDMPLPDWEIHIAGDGPYRQELESLSKGLQNNIVFHGQLPRDSSELKNLYERSKIFVLPSQAENAPLSLLEAMNAGLGVVTSNATGCRETAGDAALLIDPQDIAGIKNAILQLVQNNSLAADLGQKARQRSVSHFSWDAVVDRYIEIYQGAA